MKQFYSFLSFFVFMFSFGQTENHHFTFNNTLSNVANTATLNNTVVMPSGYTTDRFNVANSAKVLLYNNNNFDYLSGTISDLPQGSNARTFTMWVKFTASFNQAPIFGYGSQSNNQAFGLTQGVANVDPNQIENYRWGAGNSNVVTQQTAANNWYCYALVYTGTVCKIYRDGELLLTSNATTLNTVGTTLWIGRVIGDFSGRLDAHIDDLKIYNQALTDIEVATKYILESPVGSSPDITDVYTTNVFPDNATVNFTLDANGGSAASVIRYGIASNNLSQILNGPATTSNTGKYLTANITGLMPNTTYYYSVEATNTQGTTTFPTIQSFTTSASGTLAPIPTYYYDFNGNLNEKNGGISLTTTATPAYESNGINNNSAIRVNNFILSALTTKIPQDRNPRSVAFRIKYNNTSVSNQYVFAWGSQANNAGFGFAQNSNTSSELSFWSPTSNIALNATPQTWIEYVITAVWEPASNNMRIRYYRNGVEVYSGLQGGNVITNGKTFWIGQGIGTGAFNNLSADIDFVKIYNTALNASQVNELFLLSSENFNAKNLQFAMYPNPSSEILNIDLENEVRSIEIYTLQGQKILETKNKKVNISTLTNGVYMIRVEDINGAVATKKLSKD